MAAIALRLLLVVYLISVIHGRFLRLNSSDDGDNYQYLISDGVDLDHSRPAILKTCEDQYSFLPFVENSPLYILHEILAFREFLNIGVEQIERGSKVLFRKFSSSSGVVIIRLLMALPSILLIMLSGIFSSKENAQSKLSLGVGIYSGITVFSLTFHWGICVLFGRRNLTGKSNDLAEHSNSNSSPLQQKLIKFKNEGVVIDKATRDTAGIMLLSLIPYFTVEIVHIFNSSYANRIINLIALVVSSLSLISYFIHQILNPWIQERSLDYSKYGMLRKRFLKQLEEVQLVDGDGKLNIDAIQKFLSKDAENGGIDRNFVSRIMENFDSDDSTTITREEFIARCQRFIDETEQQDATSRNVLDELNQALEKKKDEDPREKDRIMSKLLKHVETQLLQSTSLITPEGRPNTKQIRIVFKKLDSDGDKSISKSDLEQLINTVQFGEFQLTCEDIVEQLFKDFDKDENCMIDEAEFVAGVSEWLHRAIKVVETTDGTTSIDAYEEIVWKEQAYDKWALITSLFQVSLGIYLLTLVGGLLIDKIIELSCAVGLQSFSISFLIAPVVINGRALLTAIWPAKQKSERSASLTFSEIYNGVIMNNIVGLTSLLLIVYARELTWDFSAEVLTITIVCAVIGTLAYSWTTYPLWTCILAFLLYPLSLGFYYFAEDFLKWI